MLRESDYNIFEIVDVLSVNDFDGLYQQINALQSQLSSREKKLLTSSYEAFCSCAASQQHQQKSADALNGYIVSESEDEATAGEISRFKSVMDPEIPALVKKRMTAIRRRAKRTVSKRIAEQNFLSRRKSSKAKGIVSKFPDIGTTIEDFVRSRNIGADKWRRTGLLTFDGNLKVNQKVTYERIRHHLQEHYKHPFSYGTVVQLCVARNKRL